MSTTQQILTIAIVVLGTMTTRFLPFLIFPANKETPAYIRYLGTTLPYASMGMLVVYCLKDVSFFSGNYGFNELICIIAVILAHKWKHNMLVSITTGTLLYMFLLQL